jgi:hypothetical protein
VGVTTIIVTHDQEEAFDLADQVGGHLGGLSREGGRWGSSGGAGCGVSPAGASDGAPRTLMAPVFMHYKQISVLKG